MKINTRKSVIFTALAVMVLTTVLIMGCTSPVSGLLEGGDEPTAPGTGRVKLSINNRNDSRTILPASLPSNRKYWVTFEHATPSLSYSVSVNSGGTISNIPARAYSGLSVIVYTSATALTSASTVEAAAIGHGTYEGTDPVTVTPGVTLNLSGDPIVTKLFAPGETLNNSPGTGTFTYNIDISNISPSILDTAEMAVVGFTSGNQVAGSPFDIKDTNSGSITIPSGYYKVLFTLNDTAATTHHAYLYQILHVYRNMTSSYAYAGFDDDIFPAPLNVGSGNLSITDISGAPTDIVYTIQEVGTSGNFALTGNASTGFVISLSKALTQPVVTINLTTTGITTVGWQNGQGTLLAGATAGQINYTINVSNFTAKNTSVSVVFTRTSDSAPLATAPITIRFSDF